MSLEIIDRRINGIRTSVANINRNVQEVAVLIMQHANGDGRGDCTRAARLARVLPPKLRPQLCKWFEAFSPINVKVGKTVAEDKASYHKPDSKAYNPFNIDGAIANPWYEFGNEPKVTEALTRKVWMDKLLDRLDNEMKSIVEGKEKFVEADRMMVAADITAIRKALAGRRAEDGIAGAMSVAPMVAVG